MWCPGPFYGGNYYDKARSRHILSAKQCSHSRSQREEAGRGEQVCPFVAGHIKPGWVAGFTRFRSQAEYNLPVFLFPDRAQGGMPHRKV